MLVRFFCCVRGCGRTERPAFPAPSEFRGRDLQAKLVRMRSGKAESCVPSLRGALATKQSRIGRVGKARLRRAHHVFRKLKMVGTLAPLLLELPRTNALCPPYSICHRPA